MDKETLGELNLLAAETIAIQNVLAEVLYQIALIGPQFDAAVRLGFDKAANGVEDITIRLGKAASADHLVKAIRIIEELRTATLGNPEKPRHAV